MLWYIQYSKRISVEDLLNKTIWRRKMIDYSLVEEKLNEEAKKTKFKCNRRNRKEFSNKYAK